MIYAIENFAIKILFTNLSALVFIAINPYLHLFSKSELIEYTVSNSSTIVTESILSNYMFKHLFQAIIRLIKTNITFLLNTKKLYRNKLCEFTFYLSDNKIN